MNQKEIEKYKREMMKMYGRNPVQPDYSTTGPNNGEELPVLEENKNVPPEQADNGVSDEDTVYDETVPDEKSYNLRFPEPDLSELDTDFGSQSTENSTPPEYSTRESLGNSIGFILVNVRTGEESAPIQNASVLVTAIIDGNRSIIASGVTNSNGTTPRFAVPVPDIQHSQSPDPTERPYSLFDVSVTAEGFFNARSVDVPVFSGITSVQNFGMIPLPVLMNQNDETVTYYNQEPVFPGKNS